MIIENRFANFYRIGAVRNSVDTRSVASDTSELEEALEHAYFARDQGTVLPHPADPLPDTKLNLHSYIPADVAAVIAERVPSEAYYLMLLANGELLILLSRDMKEDDLVPYPEKFCGLWAKYTSRCLIVSSSAPWHSM
jgi:hypothetical protein